MSALFSVLVRSPKHGKWEPYRGHNEALARKVYEVNKRRITNPDGKAELWKLEGDRGEVIARYPEPVETPPERSCGDITVTGVDERTDVDAAAKLNAEIGLLYTFDPEGRNRYPRRSWIKAAAVVLPRAAIHICGTRAREELLRGDLDDVVWNVRRIQINGVLPPIDIQRVCELYPDKQIITQHRPENSSLIEVSATNHALLVDSSGGRGLTPDGWMRPETKKEVGFAGGMGPDNIVPEVERIRQVATGKWWVDMEGKLRSDDWFSLELAQLSVDKFWGMTP